ncbi:hypothetical protein F2S88_29275, partial [Pseudomonas syringae pv. actinidiae]|nr:hypothetical protein [Pseudomonas syringae pv. actinidiae]
MSSIFTLGLSESIDNSSSLATGDLYDLVGHNTGNLAFHYGVNRIIGSVPPSLPWSAEADQINKSGSIAILPCANQLGAHADMGEMAKTFSKVTVPLVAVGLGAQASAALDDIPALSSGTIQWLHEIADHSISKNPNITTRGDFTIDVLDYYGFGHKAISLGCPSLFINNNKTLGEQLEDRYKSPFRKVAIAGGHTDHILMNKLEASLIRIMEHTRGAYIVQATDEVVALSRGDFPYVDESY